MAKIITGYTGEPHVNSDDMAALQQGIIGVDDYVLYTGADFQANAISGNTLQLTKSEVVMQGTHIRIEGDEELEIATGTQGLYRYDLIIIRYSKNADTGVESAEVDIMQGSAATNISNAKKPELTQNDIRLGGTLREVALFEVCLNGSVIQSVNRVIPLVDSLFVIMDDVEQNSSDIESVSRTVKENKSSLDTLGTNVTALQKKRDFDGALKSSSDYAKAAIMSWVSSYDTKGLPDLLAAALILQNASGSNLASARIYSDGSFRIFKGDSSYIVPMILKGSVTITPKTTTGSIGKATLPKVIGTVTIPASVSATGKSVNLSVTNYAGKDVEIDVDAALGSLITKNVTFTREFTEAPEVFLSINSANPHSCDVGVTNVTSKGFTINFQRNSATATKINWVAIGQMK